jgi:hypothetical protein
MLLDNQSQVPTGSAVPSISEAKCECGGFLSHRGTPKSSIFSRDFPANKPSSSWGSPIYGKLQLSYQKTDTTGVSQSNPTAVAVATLRRKQVNRIQMLPSKAEPPNSDFFQWTIQTTININIINNNNNDNSNSKRANNNTDHREHIPKQHGFRSRGTLVSIKLADSCGCSSLDSYQNSFVLTHP